MKKIFVFTSALAVILLVGWGCQEQSGSVASTPNPAVTAETPTVKATTIEPNQVQQPAKVEQTTKPEPNVVQTPQAEPEKQQAETPKPAPKNNAKELQTTPASTASAAQLCGSCSEFLSKYVDQQGMIDFRTLERKKLDLVNILDKFKALKPAEYNSWAKEDKIAFWINAYNLEFIKIILDNYPIESTRVLRLFWPPNSIRHIKGVWDEHKFIIMDEEFTLKAIEDRFFLKEFDEPRALFAIYYGAISGPPLRNEAYFGQKLSNQLDDQVKKFLAGPHAFKILRENEVVNLSPILQSSWYGQQFTAKYDTDRKFKQQEPVTRAVLNFLTNYLPPQDVSFLETGNYTVQYMRYDWTLNDRSGQ